MNEDLLGNCRACGQMISKNLVKDCPHCGEPEPHLTEEDERRRTEEREQEKEEAAIEKAEAKKGCLIFLVIAIILSFVFWTCWEASVDRITRENLEEVERIIRKNRVW